MAFNDTTDAIVIGGAPRAGQARATPAPKLAIAGSPGFTAWLEEAQISLVFTAALASKIFMVGSGADQQVSVFERSFPRARGVGVGASGTIWVSGLQHLWRFEQFLDPGVKADGYDALYVPTVAHTTGDIDIHDIRVRADGTPLFAATRFDCIAGLDPSYSFAPVWKPPFIGRLEARDRCHLTGLELSGDAPVWASAAAATDLPDAWRARGAPGGVLINIPSGETVAQNLSMPHAPRLHDGRLWIVQGGTGEIGIVDPADGRFTPVAFLGGYPRGLAIVGRHAMVAVSALRDGASDLPLSGRLAEQGAANWAGLAVVNLETGETEHRLFVQGAIREIDDVDVVPGVLRPAFLGIKSDHTRFTLRPGPMPPADGDGDGDPAAYA